jgi:hypothetical protein
MKEATDLERVLGKLDEIDERMTKIEKYLEKQKGFIGGVLLVASCVAWVASNIKEWFR